MRILEHPYVIVSILVFGFVIVGIIGIYFSMKCIKSANGTEEKAFSSVHKLASDFEKLGDLRKNRSVVYVEIPLDKISRLYSESKAMRMLSGISSILLSTFSEDTNGSIAFVGNKNFIAVHECLNDNKRKFIDDAMTEINAFILNDKAVNIVKIHFGYYCTESTEVPFSTALDRAKQACTMAESKNISFFEWDIANGKELERKIKIENSIQNEIDNNRFFLEYQPILDTKTNKIVGAEVLSRLNSQSDGILTPRSFLSAVSSVGLNKEFDYYIFEKNCKWISHNKLQREKYIYTINFLRATLSDVLFAENIISIIEKYGLNYSTLAVEILEDESLTEHDRNIITQNIITLKEKGIHIMLDDFGSGYTSFADLSNFDISIVKIDKTITQQAINKTGFLILKNIVQTANDLGFKTLCEGIETEEHKNAATEAGCDMLQGYYFYLPMSVAQLEQLLENDK